jgi:hypothetical protein
VRFLRRCELDPPAPDCTLSREYPSTAHRDRARAVAQPFGGVRPARGPRRHSLRHVRILRGPKTPRVEDPTVNVVDVSGRESGFDRRDPNATPASQGVRLGGSVSAARSAVASSCTAQATPATMTRMYAIARVAVASIGTSLSYSNTLVGSAASVRRRANSFCDGERRAPQAHDAR